MWHHGFAGDKGQVALADDRPQEQHHFHPRERVADASPWSTTKWEIREAWKPFGQSIRPALRAKTFWIVEKAPVAVDNPLTHHHDSARLNSKRSDAALRDRFARDDPGCRI
jgi:hypothetical protein